MTLHVYSIMWNEEFMLPHFLSHYSKFADRIFIINDHSTDKTAEIAQSHPKVTLIDYEHRGLVEKEFSETFVKLPKQFPSDWAICVDADEFIHGLETLASEPSGVLKTKGYVMIGKTGKLKDCKPVRMESFDKPVVFDPSLDVSFGDGRHSVNLPARDSKLELLHYKYPSREYYLERNLLAYPRIMDAKMADYRIKRGLGWYDKNV